MLAHHNEVLTVGTVVTGYGRDWYEIQRRFLGVGEYIHLVWAVDTDADFPGAEVIGRGTGGPDVCGNITHIEGLNALGDTMRRRNCGRCLILDSDCFPVRPDWEDILRAMLAGCRRPTAAVTRPEELAVHPHPSAVYTTNPGVLTFGMDRYRDLMGETQYDTMLSNVGPWMPLLRTNLRNWHPVMAGVYGDLFYHHGGGSRHFTALTDEYHYYDHLDRPEPFRVSERFWADPEGFVRWCRGRDD